MNKKAVIKPFYFSASDDAAAEQKPTDFQGSSRALIFDMFSDEPLITQSTIYLAYKPTAIIGKYLGIVPLSGLYEWSDSPSRITRYLIDFVLPFAALILTCFSGFNIMLLLVVCATRGFERPMVFLSIMFTNISFLVHIPLCVIILFRQSKHIIQYLHDHGPLEDLLTAKRKTISRFSYLLLIITILSLFWKTPCWISMLRLHIIDYDVDVQNIYNPTFANFALGCFCFSMLISVVAESQPVVTYVLFQYILKIAYDQLTIEIKKDAGIRDFGNVNLGAKVRRYRIINQHLYTLAKTLNDLISPTVLFSFFENGIAGIVSIFFVIDQLTVRSAHFSVAVALISLILIPFGMVAAICTSADATVTAANSVLPAIFASIPLENPDAKEEVTLFAMNENTQNIVFTASGFFEINRSILTTAVGAVATYVIIMMQFNKDPEAEEDKMSNATFPLKSTIIQNLTHL